MFHHVKELQFNARVTKPDPRFAALLLEQFGGGNGELKAAMQYFCQAFGARKPYPGIYDLLMDIATEELSHLEIVGATITMLTTGVNGELKNAVENNPVAKMAQGNGNKHDIIHEALQNPQFLVETGGGPALTNASGFPWQGTYVNSNGDPTVDLRSNIAAETRAKIVYEYLLKFTDDPMVRESLTFLMTREITHFQQFSAALENIQPNFPPGQLQGDLRYVNTAFNMSTGEDVRGPWNEGKGPLEKGEVWEYVEDPMAVVSETNGLINKETSSKKSDKEMKTLEKNLSKERSDKIKSVSPKGKQQWSSYINEE